VELRSGAHDEADLEARARLRLRPSLRRVLNGTGVVIHTNLGRAPLPQAALDALARTSAGYANLELDLDSGRRGSRDAHVRELLRELTGAEDGFAVNNGAAAALLAVAAVGAPAGGVAVSRGQLVEIGGGFRVPEVLSQAGVRLAEVGTTNRTRVADYERALADDGAGAILRVHQSNFRTLGFVEDVSIEELCALGVPVIDDLGSGALAEGLEALADEPPVRRSIAAGAALVCFSGDKLLGGPQAGILLGRAPAVQACRHHPLARALRIGRLPLAALEATLALYRDPERARREVPALAMLALDPALLTARAERLAAATGGEIVQAIARVGGGALPLLELRGPAVALTPRDDDPQALAGALRAGDPPLITRISEDRVLIDPRTLAEDELEPAARAVAQVLG
jgi:L-seryl-tRNA(Ser) seleniumtransferase